MATPAAIKVVYLFLAVLTVSVTVSKGHQVSSVSLAGPTDFSGQSVRPSVVLHEGVADDWVARANFSDEIFDNGWAYLEVETRPTASDQEQAYLAGYVEGAATHELIYNHWRNTMEGYCDWQGQEFCTNLRAFLKENRAWMDDMIKQRSASDPVWYQVSLVLQQVQGVVDGYQNVSTNPLTYEDIYWLNLMGDLEDLQSALKPNSSSSAAVRGDGHCSALIKVLPGNADLYTSHVTWNSLQSMLRIQKKYIMPLQTNKLLELDTIPGLEISFSSYPGYIHSADDYYLLSSGLATMETTIGNSNPDLWVDVTATGELQEWIRVIVSNRLAVDGESWTKIFSHYNSGTYNNQWMIVDYKLFTPYKPIRPNTLWVLEQIPGMIVGDDQSSVLLDQNYWPSYNVPFYPIIFNTSGNNENVEKYGDWFTYDKNPRAQIFARDQGNVKDLGSMINLMQYNDYKNDPLSVCDCDPPYSAENAISCRDDLNPKNGTYPFGALGSRSHVGTDMKVTTADMIQNLEFLAISGPTYVQQPVFVWSKSVFANDTPHHGHPDQWKFPVVHREWNWGSLSSPSEDIFP